MCGMKHPENLQWLIKDDSGEYGPMDFATLQQLRQEETVTEQTLIRHEEEGDWVPWGQHPLLHPEAAPTPQERPRVKLALKGKAPEPTVSAATTPVAIPRPQPAAAPVPEPDTATEEVYAQAGQIEAAAYEKKLREQRREMEKARAEALKNMPFDWGNVILPLLYLLLAGGLVWLLRHALVGMEIDAAKQPFQTFLHNTLLDVLAKERVMIVLGVWAAAIFFASWITAWLCGSHHLQPRAAGLYGMLVQAFLVVPLLLVILFTDRLIFSGMPLTALHLWLILTGIGGGCVVILYFLQMKVYEYGIWSSLLHTIVVAGICGVLLVGYLVGVEKVTPAKFQEAGTKHFATFQKQAAILYQRGEKKRELPE